MAYSPTAAAVGDPAQTPRTKDKAMATGVIGAHGLEHMYGHGFMALIPAIYDALGLVPIQASLIPAVRQLSSGLTSVFGGFLVDMFQERRGPILAFSMALIGLGYFLVAALPVYGLILAALVVASAGSALWHPPALGLLAQRFPQRRGFFMSLHRSAGNVGDTIGPVVVGVLLGVVGWRWIAGGGTPILIFLAFMILVFMWNVGGQRQPVPAGGHAAGHRHSRLQVQWESLKDAMRGGGFAAILPIFVVSAVRGMGDRTVLWVLPLYITQEVSEGGLELGYIVMGVQVALLTAPGIVAGPVFGYLSDIIGRKPVIVFIMAVAVILPFVIVWGGSNQVIPVWGGVSLVMTLGVVLFGLFHYSVNSLTQAAAIDVVEGRRLEGTFIGLMWGSNAAFGAASALLAGVIIQFYGWEMAFFFAAALFFAGFLVSLFMPGSWKPQARTA